VIEAYQPIPCAQHERLEFSILRRLGLELEYGKDGVVRREQIRPLDVNTRDGAEWLKFQDADGVVQEISLDTIRYFQELPA
jgi:Rho-binding antiterminator